LNITVVDLWFFSNIPPRSLAAFDIANIPKVVFITYLRASLIVENRDGDGNFTTLATNLEA